jgi:hypothetical protein
VLGDLSHAVSLAWNEADQFADELDAGMDWRLIANIYMRRKVNLITGSLTKVKAA